MGIIFDTSNFFAKKIVSGDFSLSYLYGSNHKA